MNGEPLDLTGDVPRGSRVGDGAGPGGSVTTRPYDPGPLREGVRSWIAGGLVALLVIVIFVLLFGVVFWGFPVENLEKVGAVVISPLVGILGAVLGFYFGEQHGRGR